MLKDITLGQYFPGNTVAHKLDPRTKILLVVLYIVALFCAKRDSLEKEYYYWMQYHLDKQFAAEARYARSKGVSLKGDLPIGVSADSADAYWHPELFNLDSTAGAPPDFFSKDGQADLLGQMLL